MSTDLINMNIGSLIDSSRETNTGFWSASVLPEKKTHSDRCRWSGTRRYHFYCHWSPSHITIQR